MDEQLEQMDKEELMELAKIQAETLEMQTRALAMIINKAALAFAIWGILQIALVILLARKR